MTALYRCNECGKETSAPFIIRTSKSVHDMDAEMHACGPNDAIRLAAMSIRDPEIKWMSVSRCEVG